MSAAAANGHLDTVRVLVKECGVDANAVNRDGGTPPYFAALKVHSDIVRFLVKECGADATDPQSETLLVAALNGHLATVRGLVKECGALDARRSDGHTALCYAAGNDHADVVRFLANECGESVDDADDEDRRL